MAAAGEKAAQAPRKRLQLPLGGIAKGRSLRPASFVQKAFEALTHLGFCIWTSIVAFVMLTL